MRVQLPRGISYQLDRLHGSGVVGLAGAGDGFIAKKDKLKK